MQSATENIAHKIASLTPEQLGKVEQLIDTLQQENVTVQALGEPSFAAVWNDPENDIYDAF